MLAMGVVELMLVPAQPSMSKPSPAPLIFPSPQLFRGGGGGSLGTRGKGVSTSLSVSVWLAWFVRALEELAVDMKWEARQLLAAQLSSATIGTLPVDSSNVHAVREDLASDDSAVPLTGYAGATTTASSLRRRKAGAV